MRKLSIAIDGPAGAGKSSIAKMLANKLNYLYIDTGAMYRAVTWAALKKDIIGDKEAIINMLPELNLLMEPTKESFKVSVFGKYVTEFIRSPQVNSNVSEIAAIKEVRAYLVERQRKMAAAGGIILDGRDIGSVVLPDADIKFYLTASVAKRAYRRWLEQKDSLNAMTLEVIEKSVANRDNLDMTRAESPLVCVDDAIVVDSSDLTFEQTAERMLNIISEESI